jgi:hypothetical protein
MEERIDIGEWMRPVLIGDRITIIAGRALNEENYEWKVTTKDIIKSISG